MNCNNKKMERHKDGKVIMHLSANRIEEKDLQQISPWVFLAILCLQWTHLWGTAVSYEAVTDLNQLQKTKGMIFMDY